jgi:hypothetical protein
VVDRCRARAGAVRHRRQNVHVARADLVVALGEFKQMHHNLAAPSEV